MLNKTNTKQGERMNNKEKQMLKNLEKTNSPMEFKLFMEENNPENFSWTFLEKFEELLLYWEQFDRLWRLSYAPPLKNERQVLNMVGILNETFGECKDLYNTCQLDLNSSAVLQYLPLEHIIFEKGFKKNAKSQQKKQKN